MDSFWQRQVVMAVTALVVCPLSAMAQQTFPRPIVLYRPPTVATPARGPVTITPVNVSRQPSNGQNQTLAANTTNGANNQGALGTTQSAPGSINDWNSATPGSQPTSGIQQFSQAGSTNPPAQAGNTSSQSQPNNADYQQSAAQQALPSLYALQNASGLHNITQTGMTNSQQYAPNLYFGQQFQTWTNQKSMSDSPASYGEMSRFQTGPFGGYVAPNTYLGSGFFNWNNLSSGNVTPGANGGWSYSTWP